MALIPQQKISDIEALASDAKPIGILSRHHRLAVGWPWRLELSLAHLHARRIHFDASIADKLLRPSAYFLIRRPNFNGPHDLVSIPYAL